MKKVIKATIKYKLMPDHPDIDCVVGGYKSGQELSFTDIYTVDTDYFCNNWEIEDYIKNDLALVAGGGYNTDHIYGERFSLERVA